MDRRPRALLLGLAGLVVSVGVGIALVKVNIRGVVDPEVAAVQQLAVETLTLEHVTGVGDLTAADAADPAGLYARAEAAARSHYTGALLTSRLVRFRALVDDHIRGTTGALGGGVKDVLIGDTTIDTTTAVVHLRATTWTSLDGVTMSGSAANNWTIGFARVYGRWLVTDIESDFRG